MRIYLVAVIAFTSVCNLGYSASGINENQIIYTPDELKLMNVKSDGDRIYSGDLIFYKDNLKGAVGGPLWIGGRFVYEFTDQTPVQQNQFMLACNEWANTTPIECVERTNEPIYTRIITHNGEGCGGFANVSCSFVGMVASPGNPQDLQIYFTHWTSGFSVIVHEIGHALGLIHEQSRSDRENYVVIYNQNIRSGAESNFRRDKYSLNFTDYDYSSIMHYSNCLFTKFPAECNRLDESTEPYWTIAPAPCSLTTVGGNAVTQLDLEGITKAYGGAVANLYKNSRRNQCGSHVYNKLQVENVCGTNCSFAGPISWLRVHTKYDKGCGWLGRLDPVLYCSNRDQELVRQWFDKDGGALRCLGGTLVERWTQCGCSTQVLIALCSDYGAGIDLAKLDELEKTGTQLEKDAVYLIREIEELRRLQKLSNEVIEYLPQFYIQFFARTQSSELAKFSSNFKIRELAFRAAIEGLLCELHIFINLQDAINNGKKITLTEFESVITKWELILNT